MKSIHKPLHLILLGCFFSFSSIAQTTFCRSIGKMVYPMMYPNNDFGYSIVRANNGNYVMAGSTQNVSTIDTLGAYIVEVDISGNIVWSKKVIQGIGVKALHIIQTTDGGFVFTGWAFNYFGDYNVIVVKLDSMGNVIWDKTVGTSGIDYGYSVLQTADNGYAIVGTSDGLGWNNIYLIRLDASGNLLWTKYYYGENGYSYGCSIVQSADNGLVISGFTSAFSTLNDNDVYVFKTDSIGNLQWTRTVGGVNDEGVSSIARTNDGGYIVSSSTNSFSIGGDYDYYLVKLDSSGNVLWTKTAGGNGDDNANEIIGTLDGGFAIVGKTRSFYNVSFGNNADVLKFSAAGNLEWSTASGEIYLNAEGNSIVQAPDSSFAVAGFIESYPAADEIFYFGMSKSGQVCCSIGNGAAISTVSSTIGSGGQDSLSLGTVFSGSRSDTGAVVTNLCIDCFSLNVVINSSSLHVCPGDSVNISATVSGGTPPYIFNWMPNGATTSSFGIVPASTTTYTLTISDQTGNCTTVDSTTIVVGTPVSISGNDTICYGGSSVITASGGLTYLWNTGDTLSSITVSPTVSTNYSVVITDSMGCVYTQPFQVTVNPCLIPASLCELVGFYSNGSFGYSVVPTFDGGYALAGCIFFSTTEAYVAKLDSLGNPQWGRSIGTDLSTANTQAYSIIQTSDSGYVFTGMIQPATFNNYDCYVVKLDKFGVMQWNKGIGGYSSDVGQSVIQTTDGGFMIAGSSSSFSTNSKIYLIKLDGSGNLQWDETIGGPTGEGAASIKQTTDGGYILVGSTMSYGAGIVDAYVVKINATGAIQWTRTIGGTDEDGASSIIQTSDGNYVLTGYTKSFGAGNYDVYVVKLDSSGTVLWTLTEGSSGYYEVGRSIIETSDGNYVICGDNASITNNNEAYVIKVSPAGNVLWARTTGGPNNDEGFSIVETPNGGLALTGLYAWTSTVWDMYFILLDNNGMGCCNSGSFGFTGSGGTFSSGGTVTSVISGVYSNYVSTQGCIVYDLCNLVTSTDVIQPKTNFVLYPNPSNGIITIESGQGQVMGDKWTVEIYNLFGEIINQSETRNPKLEIDLSTEANGIYFAVVKTEKESFTKKIIIEK